MLAGRLVTLPTLGRAERPSQSGSPGFAGTPTDQGASATPLRGDSQRKCLTFSRSGRTIRSMEKGWTRDANGWLTPTTKWLDDWHAGAIAETRASAIVTLAPPTQPQNAPQAQGSK